MDTSFKYASLCSNGAQLQEAAAAKDDSGLNGLMYRKNAGMSGGTRKSQLNVQWNDEKGKELVQIFEFSFAEDEDRDCFRCTELLATYAKVELFCNIL